MPFLLFYDHSMNIEDFFEKGFFFAKNVNSALFEIGL